MRHIQPPKVNDTTLLKRIIDAKQEPRKSSLNAIRAEVNTAYKEYSRNAPDLGHLSAAVLTDPQKEALIHAFDIETSPMAKLRVKLLKPVLLFKCPFCGIGESSTLDHYLPKQQKPQFAVFSKNLVPCCSVCNTRKSDLVIDKATDVRMFLHPYFDDVPIARFIKLTVTLTPTAIGFRYRMMQPAGMQQLVFSRLKFHFTRLRLADRYCRASVSHLREMRGSLERNYGPTKDSKRVAAELMHFATDFEEDHGPNYWQAILYRTLAGNHAFCDGKFRVLDEVQ